MIVGKVKNTRDEVLKIKQLSINGNLNGFILITLAMHVRRAEIFNSLDLRPDLHLLIDRLANVKITVKDFKPCGTVVLIKYSMNLQGIFNLF